uniref:Uncharacterized protein n=1 Tax=Tanacetum cinerariifolium TaxID=118510 RepID=A0A6L2N4V0_TANCI|nr:hypothetical protein [Tanacetum cinerariifolium]
MSPRSPIYKIHHPPSPCTAAGSRHHRTTKAAATSPRCHHHLQHHHSRHSPPYFRPRHYHHHTTAAAVVGCGWRIGHHHRGAARRQTTIVVAVERRYSHHSRTMWCLAVMAQPLVKHRGDKPPKTTTVVAAEPTTTTTATPWWCRACGGDPPFIVMANPNPEDPNTPNEGVPKEDPYHLLDFDEEEDPEIDIEEEELEEDPVDDHNDVEEEDDENEDVDIEEDDDAEIIFPYEVQGDQTPPPEDESFDYEFEAEEADNELKVEEAVTGSQMPFAVRDFPMGFHEAGESSTARDLEFVGGMAPWALRRDLEVLRRQERIREAESGTSRTEIALLGSKARIGKMDREILHHDLSGVEETLENVVVRLKVLESGENATLKKKLAKKEMLLDLTRMIEIGLRRGCLSRFGGTRDFIWRWFVRERFPNRHLMRALSARERCQRSLMEMRDLLTPVDLLCDSQ